MQKRPLCLAALLLLMILWILPGDVWLKEPDISSGEQIIITGKVFKREQKEDQQVYYLKNCQCIQTDSKFSVLAYMQKGNSYPVGCEISLYGTIYQLNKADNPGQFDAENYYQSQGILYTFQTKQVMSSQGGSLFKENITRLKEFLGGRIMELYGKRDGGILKAVLLGDKSSLREEDELLYQKNGISHLLAISGLHISMIGISFYKVLRKCGLVFWEAGIPSGGLLVVYGMMTGFGISTIRAICMFLVLIFADIFGKAYDMASAMALAAVIILIRNPLQARQAGFLLSFGAVLGVCFVYPILQSVFETKKKHVQSVLFSISIFLVTYPLTIHFFYEYPLYSMLLNYIVIPLMPLVMFFGSLGTIAGCVIPLLGKWIGVPMHFVLSFYELLGNCVVKMPASVVRLGREDRWQLVIYYLVLIICMLFLWYKRKKSFVLLIFVAVLAVTVRFRNALEVTMLDVGQGDGIFLRLPGDTTCFIDGGSTSVKNVGKYRILPYLKYEGVSKIDYVIFSHFDEDHVNGIKELLEMSGSPDGIKIKNILVPAVGNLTENDNEIWRLGEKSGAKVERIGAGGRIRGTEWEMVCLYPTKRSQSGDKNDSSTVLQLKYGAFTMLLTGDLGFEGELNLLEAGVLEDIDVWKVSHHGSKYSGSEDFLDAIRPNVSLISVGRNYYGHPSGEILERITRVGSQVWNTLDSGAIMIKSDGKTYKIRCQR